MPRPDDKGPGGHKLPPGLEKVGRTMAEAKAEAKARIISNRPANVVAQGRPPVQQGNPPVTQMTVLVRGPLGLRSQTPNVSVRKIG